MQTRYQLRYSPVGSRQGSSRSGCHTASVRSRTVPMTPSEVGARAEREVAYALERAGWTVYTPLFAVHSRVHLIALRGAQLLRLQVKTSAVRGTALAFRTCSNTRNVPRDYRGEVDAFGVYSPELDRVYVVPIDGLASRICYLRLAPARSGQVRGTRLAAGFEVRPPG